MKRMFVGLLFYIAMSAPALAATETITVDYLPLGEAAELARSQLSPEGRVATLPSRRLLILEDDEAHLKKARELLKKFDRMPEQFTVQVEIEAIEVTSRSGGGISGAYSSQVPLKGGWLRVQLNQQQTHTSNRQSFQLRVSGGEPGNLEVGEIQPMAQEIRQWLSGYGLIRQESVELVTLTSGFHLRLWPVAGDKVRIRITPWMQRLQPQLHGQQEVLVDLGSTDAPKGAPGNKAPMRLNAMPAHKQQGIVEIAGAATEITLPAGETVTVAATSSEAEKLGSALLSRYSSTEERQFVIRLRVSKH